MYSNEDLERFYFKYQTEALPHGISVQTFCLTNNVPYNIFFKWYKDTRHKVVEVQVDGRPPVMNDEDFSDATTPNVHSVSQAPPAIGKHSLQTNPTGCSEKIRIWVELHISNGLYLSKKNLNYQELRSMIEKLEGLC